MNFYSSPAFLETLAAVYFPRKHTEIQDFCIDGKVFRFLVVGGRKVISDWTFLDYAEPIALAESSQRSRQHIFVPNAVHAVVTMQQWTDDELLRVHRPAPFVDFAGFPKFGDYQSFLMKRSKDRFKKNYRLRERLEADYGTLVFTPNDNSDDVIAKSLDWKSAQLRDTGLPDIFRKPENTEFYHELKRRGILICSTLRANGRLLSSWLGYIHDGYWSGWIFTYDHDPALKKYSLGWQLMDSLLQNCHERQLKGFDFSVGQSDYKMTYGTHVRLLGSIGTHPLHEKLMLELKQRAKTALTRFPGLADRIRRTVRRLRS